MFRLSFFIILMVVAFTCYPTSVVLADPQVDVESIPFDTTGAHTPSVGLLSPEDTAHHDDHAEAGGLPQFDTTTFSSQLFWLAISFSILFLYFKYAALPSLSSVIESRHMTVRNDREEAESLTNEAETAKTNYHQSMEKAYEDARLIVEQEKERIRAEDQAALDAFKEKSRREITLTESRAKQQAQAMKEQLQNDVADLTRTIVKKLSGMDVRDKTIEEAVQSNMARNDDDMATDDQQKAA